MSVLAFDTQQTRRYSLKSDTSDDKTYFILGMLGSRLETYINDRQTTFSVGKGGSNGQADVQINLNARNLDVVRFGLKGWDNFKDIRGNEIKFYTMSFTLPGMKPVMGLTDACLDAVKPYISELAAEILKDNVFTELDEKNSDAP